MYLVFDGVENETHLIEDETEAKTKLKEIIDSSLEGGEWMYGVENSCIAKVTTVIDRKEIDTPDDYRLDTGISKWFEMNMKDV
jgi:hypothetical protein